MGNTSSLKKSLQNLQADSFETVVASIWSSMGWSTEVTASSRDKGIDIIATKSDIYNQKAVIQAKCYSENKKVGRPDIQQYSTLKKQIPDADTVIVVTSSSFTSDAQKLAEELNVKIINGSELAEAASANLPEKELDTIQHQEIAEDNVRPQPPKDTISTDNLNQSEEDLTSIYQGYYKRHIKDAKDPIEKDRRLIFQLDGGEQFDKRDYILRDRTHYLRLYPEPTELLERLAMTADKYGWKVLNLEVEQVNRAGHTINRVKNNSAFSIVLDTGKAGESADPKRQAKISSLLFSTVFDQRLSGVVVKEATGIYTRTSPTAEIK